MKKILLFLFLIGLFLGTFYFLWLSQRYTIPILTYHNIGYEKESFFVSPENFAKQMEYIKKNGYQVISLDELVSSIQGKVSFKRNRVVITFDDGYKDSFQYAYPVLKKYGFPVTIFLISDFVGRDFKSKKKFLNWEEIITMSKGGVSFGSHTKTHFYLGNMEDEKLVMNEIRGSKEVIEKRLGTSVDYLCYPSGGFNERIKELVAKAGYKGACTTNRGFADFNSDVYELKRIKVTNADMNNPISFWLKLSGYYNIFRKEKSPN